MSKKIVKAAKAVKQTAKNTEKKRIRKPRTEAQKARRRELDAIRRAEAKKHAVAAKPAQKKPAAISRKAALDAINEFSHTMSDAWQKLIRAIV